MAEDILSMACGEELLGTSLIEFWNQVSDQYDDNR